MLYKHPLKISIIGSPDELTSKWIRNYFDEKSPHSFHHQDYKPIVGVNTTFAQITVENTNIKLLLTDISSERFHLSKSHFHGSSAGIFTYDKSARDSFTAVKDWYNSFKVQIPEPPVPIAIVGFLTESEEVTTEEGETLAEELGAWYYETKPINTEITDKIFQNLMEQIQKIRSLE